MQYLSVSPSHCKTVFAIKINKSFKNKINEYKLMSQLRKAMLQASNKEFTMLRMSVCFLMFFKLKKARSSTPNQSGFVASYW